MNQTRAGPTAFFEEPFWTALYERETDGKYKVCKVTFGAEPKDWEEYQFILDNWHTLRFSPSIESDMADKKRISPKRMQREARRETLNTALAQKLSRL